MLIERLDEFASFTGINGLLGAGKSKLMTAIRNVITREDVCALNPPPASVSEPRDLFLMIDEPVNDWCEKKCSLLDCDGEGTDPELYAPLDLFYSTNEVGKPNPNALPFQIYTFTTRMEHMLATIAKLPRYEENVRVHIISERSIRTDRVFFKNIYVNKGVKEYEWQYYERFYAMITGPTLEREDLMVRLNTSPTKSHTRLNERARQAEMKNEIKLNYLESLEKQHEEMYANFAAQKGSDKVIDLNFERDMSDTQIEQIAIDLIARIKNLRVS